MCGARSIFVAIAIFQPFAAIGRIAGCRGRRERGTERICAPVSICPSPVRRMDMSRTTDDLSSPDYAGTPLMKPSLESETAAGSPARTLHRDHRWLALIVLCLGVLMIVLDTTIVNVALPSIKSDLQLLRNVARLGRQRVHADFGGFLLLGGRLGDLYGHRRLFLLGITLFTLASLACGLATTQVVADRGARDRRAWAVRRSRRVALSLIMDLFHRARRSRQGDGRLRLRLRRRRQHRRAARRPADGHARTGTGSSSSTCRSASSCSRCRLALLPDGHKAGANRSLDVAGAVTVTASLMLAVYAIVNGNEAGWTSIADA